MLREADVSLTATACEMDVPDTATCGLARVPSDWSAPGRGTIEVFYAVLPAKTGPSKGTVIPFMGGPGESITAVIDLFVPFSDAVADRDMLIVDVRGAGRSGVLACPVLDDATEFAGDDEQVRRIGACGDQLGVRRNDYTTAASAMDIEAIRRSLDLLPPSLIGFSYGTWMVQVYTQLFPGEVRAAVLDGAFPLDQDPWAQDVPNSFERVLELRCERTDACPDGAPAVASAIRIVAGALAAEPVDLPDLTQDLTEGAFASVLQFSLQGEGFASFVTTVESALEGDYDALAGLAAAALRIPAHDTSSVSPALSAVVSCNDFVAPFDLTDDRATRRSDYQQRLDALPADAFGLISPEGWMNSAWEQGDSCLDWPEPDIAAELRVPRDEQRPDVPVLIVNGDIDLQTPLLGAEKIAAAFPNSVLVTVPNAAHVAFPVSDCAAALETAFLLDPSLPAADACADAPVPG